jgi:hypothetical protein
MRACTDYVQQVSFTVQPKSSEGVVKTTLSASTNFEVGMRMASSYVLDACGR